jgi:amino acid transporter
MLIAMPQKEIGVLSGVLQAISVMSTRTGLTGVVAPLALLECIAILGTASAWFSGAARLPFVAGVDRYLPPIIGRLHPRYHTPYVSLILFAILSSLLIATSFLGVSVGEAFLTMLDLAVILQLSPSAYMFLALLKHTWSKGAVLNANKAYLTANAVAGLGATFVGLIVAFIPGRQVNSVWIYEAKLIAGCIIVFGSAFFFYQRAKARTAPEMVPGVEYGA